ncbi:MAG TPA: hypothetical protein VFC84_12185 [Desulfosporosinus sp.]|nr:hypothetical protein [Desulfosporosinus sp.]
MTIVATYRLDDRAIYLNDFRVTIKNPDRQLDASFKFQDSDKRMGLFLAGDVYMWKALLPVVEKIINNVTINNVLKVDGPFREALQMKCEECPSDRYGRSGALGFLIDDVNKQNVQFRIDVVPGRGCMIEPIPVDTCVVIGSGNSIPNIESDIKESVKRDINSYGEDLYKLGNSMRDEVLQKLHLCGPTSFSKLGISPCMAISTLAGSHFMVRGEVLKGHVVSEQRSYFYNFSFERNSAGKIVLEDHLTTKTQIINDIGKMDQSLNGDIFDPKKLTEGDDPSQLFPSEDVVYLFEQWIAGNGEIWRSIDAITFLKFKDKRICNPDRRRIVGVLDEGLSAEELEHYTGLQKHYFTINREVTDQFERDVTTRIFEHKAH